MDLEVPGTDSLATGANPQDRPRHLDSLACPAYALDSERGPALWLPPFGASLPPRNNLPALLGRCTHKIAIDDSDLINVRIGPLCELKSDISRGPRSAPQAAESRCSNIPCPEGRGT